MKLTFANEFGQSFSLEVDPDMELENIMALLEAESNIPVAEQSISIDGRDLTDPKKTMSQCGVAEDAVLLLRRKVVVAGREGQQDAEMMRLQLLGNPDLMRQLEQMNPALAAAAQSSPDQFANLLRQTADQQRRAEMEKDHEIALLNADPFNIEAQRKIEEVIRQQAVMENMEHALEWSPESFGRVTMLYVPVEVNGTPVTAFVDSGAQSTIMSPEYAEKCGIMRLLDRRFSGIARGVGTAQILGRVHSVPLKIANLHLPCAITVMEGRDVDLLFGLDMLKAHQACIDLEKNVLRIQGREVGFLAEHELPEKARMMGVGESVEGPGSGPSPSLAGPSSSSSRPSGSGSSGQQSFPGSGHSLGAQPAASPPRQPSGGQQSRYPESAIQTLVGLGVSREQAIGALDAAGGNVDVAASMLF